jgi:hypothetical protein
MMILKKYILLIGIVSSAYLGCTDNPFFEDTDFQSDKLIVRGTVELDQSDDPSGVYVWLEGLNVSTYTKSDGQFELHLASPAILPGGATAWNGVYTLYYYLANYKYESSSILIRNGKVEYGKLDVDNKGMINQKIKLTELLGIKTTINPCSTETNTIFRQKVDLSFIINGESVTVETYVPLDATSGCIIFKRLDAEQTLSKFVLANKNTLRIIDISSSDVWNMQLGDTDELGIMNMDPIPVESGLYEVVPFLLIEQEGVPKELLQSISPYYDSFSAEYLKLPFKWDVDTFKVK